MTTVTRKIEFDAGHRVLGHEGKCRHVHGHRYVAEVTVEAPELDGLGRVIDFSVLKTAVGGWVDANWDHNLLLHPDDPLAQLWFRQVPISQQPLFGGKEPYVMPNGNPTAENIAQDLFVQATRLLPPELKVVRVRVWETPSCYADFVPDS